MAEREPYKRAGNEMDLPAGKTCGDCVHCRRCTLMFGHIPADEACDWSPSRFREAEQAAPAGAGQAFQPKGGMCGTCTNAKADCSGLPFDLMPVIERTPEAIIVRCTQHQRREGSA